MKIKIDEKLICIPPYVSTTWDQVLFLQSEQDPETLSLTLVVHMPEGKTARIPNVDSSLVDIAFAAHVKHLETHTIRPLQTAEGQNGAQVAASVLQQLTGLSPDQITNMPFRFSISGIEGMPGMEALQHNAAYSGASDMPAEVVEKISGMIKMFSNGAIEAFPKPELHCNCPHCQLARSIHNLSKPESEPAEALVTDEELRFRDWEITPAGDKLYTVTSPLDPHEQYHVFLGTPVGCTCGTSHCEHIKAVLQS